MTEDGLYMAESIRQSIKDLPNCLDILVSRMGSEVASKRAKYQEEVTLLMLVLPGNLRYEQVEAALKASRHTPESLYLITSAGEPLPAEFREALYGPGKKS